ncbi:hypothetical protein DFA_00212 [Cavenderia fasciculata]|uniref:Uncharacterized protein n=1 Tax=Cavenderia fasciculata TaxID=261658 RepID=F4PXX4_CACFS|nr:uncharacterized protein DFA_00212 [Cavenderia fasciculata]EGG19634.1 hypothetical protein DFA_00212 [Cavenderia fasciculata]|eukprot:XP_004357928.1 hypothetical protein DFA_00212 [Cavenderia fasciculata]
MNNEYSNFQEDEESEEEEKKLLVFTENQHSTILFLQERTLIGKTSKVNSTSSTAPHHITSINSQLQGQKTDKQTKRKREINSKDKISKEQEEALVSDPQHV